MKTKNEAGCRFLPAFLCLYLLAGCTKFVSIDPPTTQVEARQVFESDQAATSAVTGLYARMMQTNLQLMSGALTLYPGLSADEMYHTVASADNDLFLRNNLQVDNGTGNYVRLWRTAYQYIYQANAILEGLDGAATLTDSVRSRLAGEMLVVRSLTYFYLVNLYGDVPYVSGTDYRVNQQLPRTPAATIYQQLVTDLNTAKGLLKPAAAVAGRTRPGHYAAVALLARIYLYRKDWVNAAAEATAIIQRDQYALAMNLNNVFLPASAETIWQLVKDNGNTGEGFSFIPVSASVRPPYSITNVLLNAFESGDRRKTSWLSKNTVAGVDYYYPYKYKVRIETPVTEYYVVLRLAEQYLIRAEARAALNNLDEARSDLNIVRNRAGLGPTNASTQNGLLAALEKERQVELFLEWGHRWMDIKRLGRADAVFGPVKMPDWQPTDVLYPIPLREMETNPFLVQNPGYQ